MLRLILLNQVVKDKEIELVCMSSCVEDNSILINFIDIMINLVIDVYIFFCQFDIYV